MTRLVDDIDGSDAVTTLSFGLDGHSYEIDLSEPHLSAFRTALAPFISAARAVPDGRRAPVPRRVSAPRGRVAPARAAQESVQEVVAQEAGDEKAVREVAEEATEEAFEESVRPSVDAQPFRQPNPFGEPSAARARRKQAPLVADPFNPRV